MRHQVLIRTWQNEASADAICARLEIDGMPCWLPHRDHKADIDNLLAIHDEILAALDASQIVVLILSRKNLMFTIEVGSFLDRASKANKPILPVFLDGFRSAPELSDRVKSGWELLAGLHWIDASGMPLPQELTALSKTVRHMIELSGVAPQVNPRTRAADAAEPEREATAQGRPQGNPADRGMALRHRVLISYSGGDQATADAVCARLEMEGIPCWLAHRDSRTSSLAAGVVEYRAVIAACQIIVLVFSHNSESRRIDIVKALLVPASEANKPIVPVLIDDFRPGPDMTCYLGGLHWLDVSHVPLSEAVTTISKTVRQILESSGSELQARRQPQPAEPIELRKEASAQTRRYDVFISYRRETDAQTARLIRAELQRRAFRIFLDVDDLRPGHFDTALLERIDEAQSFLLILSKGSLDRSTDPDDWLRREIIRALGKEKKIIPILMPGFVFPAKEAIPQELWPIRLHQGVSYSHEFFEAMIQRIIDYLGTPAGG